MIKFYSGMKTQSGAGLIEVMAALLVLSTALLALAALHTRSLQFNHNAYMRSQANIYAYDMLDRMRLNIGNLASYESALAGVDADDEPVTAPIAAADLYTWRKNIASVMPNGKAGIDCEEKLCVLTITWDEVNSSGMENEDKSTYTYAAKL